MSKICVIYPTESLVDEFGPSFEGKFGVCIIDGDEAETSIIHRSELRSLTGDLDCVPSNGARVCLLPLDDELEAYRRIRQEAADFATVSRVRLPTGYYKPQALWFGLFSLSIEVGSIRIKVGNGLATALGWREGDGVAFGVSPDEKTLAFCYDSSGSRLAGSDLVASYPLGVGLPRELETLTPGNWVSVAVEVRDQVVFVRLEDFITAARHAPKDEDDDMESKDHGLVENDEPEHASPLLARLYWCLGLFNAITPIR
jgi:hypothetical protein